MKGVFKNFNNQDKSVTPFKAFKSWGFTTSASLDSFNINRLVAIKPNHAYYSGNVVTLGSTQTTADSASYTVNIANNKPASVIWYSINHLYYKGAGVPYDTFGNSDPYAIQRKLYTEASIFSIPQLCMGEGIKPGSVNISLLNTNISSNAINLIDDTKGNLIDTVLSSSVSNQIYYLRLNEHTYEQDWSIIPSSSYSISYIQKFKIDSIDTELTTTGQNIQISTKPSASWGNAAYFSGNGYIRIPNSRTVNFTQNTDFTLAFWLSNTNTDFQKDYIVTKRSTGTGTVSNKSKTLSVTNVNYNATQYPFEIAYIPDPIVSGSGIISCKQSTGATTTEVSSSLLANGYRNHIALIKSGSTFNLYVNGTISNTAQLTSGHINNQADIFIGSLGVDNNGNGISGFNGSIDEFFIFNKGLSTSEVNQLSYTGSLDIMSTNTNIVGNVFYEHGMIVLSDPRPKYTNTQYRLFNDATYNSNTGNNNPSYLSSFNLNYNSTVSLYEHQYLCRINEDEFNLTTNLTAQETSFTSYLSSSYDFTIGPSTGQFAGVFSGSSFVTPQLGSNNVALTVTVGSFTPGNKYLFFHDSNNWIYCNLADGGDGFSHITYDDNSPRMPIGGIGAQLIGPPWYINTLAETYTEVTQSAAVLNNDFNPYITTIGLYTDKGELAAVAKLSNPIKKRDNVDLNVVVRFDI